MIADFLVELEKRIEVLEKEIAELKVQVSVRPEVDGKEIIKAINEVHRANPTLLKL